MDQSKRKIDLNEVLEKTSTSIELIEDGSIVVHHYDFSPAAQDHFGNDVAFIITVPPSSVKLLHELLSLSGAFRTDDDADLRLMQVIQNQFRGYHAFQNFLQEKEVPYEKKFDSWA
jgi:hypothetical protein